MKRILAVSVLLRLAGALAVAQVAPAPPALPVIAAEAPAAPVAPAPPAAPIVAQVTPAPAAPPTPPTPAAPPTPPTPPAMPAMPPIPAIGDWNGSYFGVGVQDVDPETAKNLKLPEARGVEVTMVVEDSPAAKAGMKEHDVILEYNGQRVEGEEQFARLVRETPPGRAVKVVISRGGATQTLTATVAKRTHMYRMDPKFEQEMKKFGEQMGRQFGPGSKFQQDIQRQYGPGSKFEQDMKKLGEEIGSQFGENSDFQREMKKLQQDLGRMQFDLHDQHDMPEGVIAWRTPRLGIEGERVGSQLAEFFGVKEGVLVRSVSKDSPADKAGIKAGDVITKIGSTTVLRPADISNALRQAEAGKQVPVSIVRNKQPVTLNITVQKPQRTEMHPPRIQHLERYDFEPHGRVISFSDSLL